MVDDNAINRTVLGRMLKALNYEKIEFAEDGSQVLDLMFEQGRLYDVILMDLHMPILDGLGCQKAIAERLPLKVRPFVIAVTADVTQGIEMRCRDAGMVGYLSKPLAKARLDEVIHQVFASIVASSPPSWLS